LISGVPAPADQRNQVILVHRDDQTIGLLVDELHGVPEFNDNQLMRTPFGNASDGALVKHFIKAHGGQVLIQVIDVDALFATQLPALT
jgi:chemotaxis signal transduction protein